MKDCRERAQSIIEYVMLFAIVAAAVTVTYKYVYRSMNARLKEVQDELTYTRYGGAGALGDLGDDESGGDDNGGGTGGGGTGGGGTGGGGCPPGTQTVSYPCIRHDTGRWSLCYRCEGARRD